MAIRTREEILASVRARIGDDTSDEAIAFVEDIEDTINNYENNPNNDGTDWKKKYEDNDKEWRTKYRDRFFKGDTGDDDDIHEGAPRKLTFESLFKED